MVGSILKPMKNVAVVIVSYNVRELLAACLESVYASCGVGLDLWVVDNASEDGSAAMVSERFPQAQLIASPVNGGYSYANNLALRRLGFSDEPAPADPGCDYVLLLNPDTVVAPDDLAEAVAYMEAHPEVGILGPKLVREDGSMDLACRRSFSTPEVSFYRLVGLSKLFPKSRRFGRYNLTYLDPDLTTEVDMVAGAFMLVRREAVEQAGLLDERFFMYGEDMDWALRIKGLGWTVVYYPELRVFHVKGASSRQRRRQTIRVFHESMLLFYRKHYAPTTPQVLGWAIELVVRLHCWWAYLQHDVSRLRPKRRRPALGASGMR